MNRCILLLLFNDFCSGNSLNLACSLLLIPGTSYWEQALVSFLFRVNCSRNSKYGIDEKTCCSLYPVLGTLFQEQKRCTRPIYYNFAMGGGGKSDFNEGLFNVHVKQIIGNKDCLCIQPLNYLGWNGHIK